MYTSVYQLTQSNHDKKKKYEERWKTYEGVHLRSHLLKTLKFQKHYDHLRKDFEQNKLPLLEHAHDFKGLILEDEVLDLKYAPGLRGAELSYVTLTNTVFKNVDFSTANISFATLFNVKFENCLFSYTNFYACYFENVTFTGCDFMERNDIRNCRFTNGSFHRCFIENNVFHSCRFDEQTKIDAMQPRSHLSEKPIEFNPKDLAEIYKGLKNSYNDGKVINKSRDCYYLERKAVTRYIIDNKFEKIGNYFLEFIVGYGVKPFRVLLWMVLIYSLFSVLFMNRLGYPDGLFISTGAYFTNGAGSNRLQDLDIFYHGLFIMESFIGIVLTTMFVTVLANLWLRER